MQLPFGVLGQGSGIDRAIGRRACVFFRMFAMRLLMAASIAGLRQQQEFLQRLQAE